LLDPERFSDAFGQAFQRDQGEAPPALVSVQLLCPRHQLDLQPQDREAEIKLDQPVLVHCPAEGCPINVQVVLVKAVNPEVNGG
jgi:hypothetical protein